MTEKSKDGKSNLVTLDLNDGCLKSGGEEEEEGDPMLSLEVIFEAQSQAADPARE